MAGWDGIVVITVLGTTAIREIGRGRDGSPEVRPPIQTE